MLFSEPLLKLWMKICIAPEDRSSRPILIWLQHAEVQSVMLIFFLVPWWIGFKQMAGGSLWNTRDCNCCNCKESLLRHKHRFYLPRGASPPHVFTSTIHQTLTSSSARSLIVSRLPATFSSYRGFINQFPWKKINRLEVDSEKRRKWNN